MSKQIYIVTAGEYSDYSIRGVFEDKYVAEEYANQITSRYNQAQVEVHDIKTSIDLLLPRGFKRYTVIMDIDGNTISSPFSAGDDPVEQCKCFDMEDFPEINAKITGEKKEYVTYYTGNYIFYVNTNKGRNGVLKIANERRVRLIAENKWPKKGEVVASDEG